MPHSKRLTLPFFIFYSSSRVRTVKHQFSGSLEPANGLPLISFGSAMVGRDGVHLRGHTVGRTDLVRRHLLERQKRALCLVSHTDEFWTSQNCHLCGEQLSPVRGTDGHVFSLKHCSNCVAIWDRDACAASNMFWILEETVQNGVRPLTLTRPPADRPPRPTLPSEPLWRP
ncbi:hypothetical protein DM01DRAFT_1150671 [Hesseltinella vesiculosa]|uniref:Cas12f1-like TNB domain-containing protein n=1 Tax=Hesseltinella vesiculosa TaxID=101127 RepID=A0A1X2G6B5_9FUNG|nr:hypothetical protein DM01DRAFT_1150671 [Hesseltinella vesiculosa]